MGRFLQKTNIIRDYLEDLVEGRAFWPREIWGRYAPGLANLRAKVDAYQNQTRGGGVATEDTAAQEDQARACLNHLVADAMTLAPSCLRYMARLRQPDVFRFCAIPQVMAIATLDKLTNNADVFTGVVKIRKGQALQLMNNAGSMGNLHTTFLKHARSIRAKVPAHHTAARGLLEGAVADLERTCLEGLNRGGPTTGGLVARTLFSTPASVVVALLLAYLLQHLYKRSRAWDAFLPRITDSWDVAALALAVSCALFLLVFGGVPVVQSLSSPAEISASPKAADGARASAFGASLPSEGDLAAKGAGAGSAAVSRGGVAAGTR
jgi:farnesyl-diphosphate farnesyltransferase